MQFLRLTDINYVYGCMYKNATKSKTGIKSLDLNK